jgi:hypothetical protein
VCGREKIGRREKEKKRERNEQTEERKGN